jgi:hypothetical protein
MQSYIDRVGGKVIVKVDGKVYETTPSKQKLTNDPAPEISEEQIKQQELQQADIEVEKAIEQMKQKKEILECGACDQQEYDRKVSEYKVAKTKYDNLKG